MAKAPQDIRSLARAHTQMCINTLKGIAQQKGAPPAARVSAVVALLDRGWGRPHQTVGGEDGKDIRITIRKIVDKGDD